MILNRESSYVASVVFAGYPPYKWTVTGAIPLGMVALDDPSGNLTFWGVPTVAGSYPVTVRVTDAKGNAGIRIIPLRVTPLHGTDFALPDGVAGVMNRVPLSAEGGSPPYRWSLVEALLLPAGLTVSDSGVLSGIPPNPGSFGFTAMVTDARSDTVNLLFFWQVVDIQILTSRSLPSTAISQPYSLQLEALSAAPGYTWALDPPDCPLRGLTLSPDGLISGTPNSPGNISCGMTVTDTRGHSALYHFDLFVTARGMFASIDGPLAGNVSVGEYFIQFPQICCARPFTVVAVPESGVPPGLTLTDEVLSGYPSKPGAYAFQIQVTDAVGSTASTRAYINVSPLHIFPSPPSGLFNQPYSYQFRILEHQPTLLWSIAPSDRLPVGLKLSPDGLLSGTPAETGDFTFTVRANDAVAEVTLLIDSGSVRTYYVFPESLITADVGMPFDHSLSPFPVTFSISSGKLPPGLEISPQGEISGTPTTAGVYTFTVRLDGTQGFGVGVVTIRVGVVQGETRTLPNGTIGQPYAAQLKGGTLAPGESLPSGLTLSPDGKLSGTPTAAWLYQFSVVLTDSTGDSVTSTYTLEVLSGSSTT